MKGKSPPAENHNVTRKDRKDRCPESSESGAALEKSGHVNILGTKIPDAL